MKKESKVRLLAKSVKTKRVYTLIIGSYILLSFPYIMYTNLVNFLIMILLIMSMLGFYLNEEINKNERLSNLSIGDIVQYQGYIGQVAGIKEKSLIVQSGDSKLEVSKRFCSILECKSELT